MSLSVGIMGAGRMAQGFDAPGDVQVLSLAHAVTRCPDMELGGFYDHDPARSAAAEQKWSCPESPREREAWLARDWDLIFIATPNDRHAEDASDAIAQSPKAILVEKPLAKDPDAADALLRMAESHDVPLMVDYPRRAHSAIAAVGEQVRAGALGHPAAGTFVYSGDAGHAATHMIDLFQGWWGSWTAARSAGTAEACMVELQNGANRFAATFISLPGGAHYVWELTVFCQHGRVRLSESPEYLDVSTPKPHPAYDAFDVLQSDARYAMEDEPLLERTMDRLVQMARDPEAARRQHVRETESQALCGDILRALDARCNEQSAA